MKIEIITFAQSLGLKTRGDADLLLTKPAGWDVKVIKFQSRSALERFNERAGLHSVVKTIVPRGCAIYRHQQELTSS